LRKEGDDEFDDEEFQDIIDRVDKENPNRIGFANIEEFIEFNKKRTDLI